MADILRKTAAQLAAEDASAALPAAIATGAVKELPATQIDAIQRPAEIPQAAAPPDALPAPNVPIQPAPIPSVLASATQVDQPDTQPALAEQGPKNPLLRALSNFAGLTAAQPKPGEQYEGPTNSGEKMNAIRHLVGGIAGGLVNAAGTPEQQGTERQREENEAQIPLKLQQQEYANEYHKATIGERDKYHTGVVDLRNNANDIAQQKADTQEDRLDAVMLTKGLKRDPNNPHNFIPLTADEVLDNKVLSSDLEVKRTAAALKHVQTGVQEAKKVLMSDPRNAPYALLKQRLEMQERVLQTQLGFKLHSQNASDMRDLYTFGADVNGTRLTNDNAAPGMLIDPNTGQPVPYKQNSTFAPTGQMKTRGQMGTTMPQHINEMSSLIDQAADKGYIGPVSGRIYREFLAGKVGSTGDPQADELLGQLQAAKVFLASGVNVMHYGGRGGQDSYGKFEQMLADGASKENLNGALKEIAHYGESYKDAGVPKTTTGGRGATTPASGSTIPYHFPDGSVRNIRPEQVQKAESLGARRQ